MIVVLVVESVILVVLCILVAGLLRSYATVLQRLHAMDGGDGGQRTAPPPFRTADGVVGPPVARSAGLPAQPEWGPAHDIVGVGLDGEIISVRTIGTELDTVLVFLSSGCAGCGGFWQDFAQRRELSLAPDGRVIVITKDPESESIAQLAELCPRGVDLVMSTRAWEDYAVPGSPYVVVVNGRSGRVSGEGSGTSLSQLAGLVRQATGDLAGVGSSASGRAPSSIGRQIRKPRADLDREVDVDRMLLAVGISPGDPSLYPSAETAANAPGPELIGFPGHRSGPST